MFEHDRGEACAQEWCCAGRVLLRKTQAEISMPSGNNRANVNAPAASGTSGFVGPHLI